MASEAKENQAAGHRPLRGLVMTMGALHAGHAALMQECRKRCDFLVLSIYVNPLQFGPGEDFASYPRTLEADLELAAANGVDLVFAPSDEEMYPQWPTTPLVSLNPGPVARMYEGAARPTHFAGVLQVVNKVFNLVRPDVTCFGQKDAQQLALVSTMVRDLDMGIEVVAVPIERDHDGLALSSRNTYLSATERRQALNLYQALRAGVKVGQEGGSPAEVLTAVRMVLTNADLNPDYVTLVDPLTFNRIDDNRPDLARPATLALACRVGKTRLLDNVCFTLGGNNL